MEGSSNFMDCFLTASFTKISGKEAGVDVFNQGISLASLNTLL